MFRQCVRPVARWYRAFEKSYWQLKCEWSVNV